jgi:hypothetical protein
MKGEQKLGKYPVDKIPTTFKQFYFRPEYVKDCINILIFTDTKTQEKLSTPRVLVHTSSMYNLVQFLFEFSPGIYAGAALTQENEKHLVKSIEDPRIPLLRYKVIDRNTGDVLCDNPIFISDKMLSYALESIKTIPVPPDWESLVMVREMKKAVPLSQMVEEALTQMAEANLI